MKEQRRYDITYTSKATDILLDYTPWCTSVVSTANVCFNTNSKLSYKINIWLPDVENRSKQQLVDEFRTEPCRSQMKLPTRATLVTELLNKVAHLSRGLHGSSHDHSMPACTVAGIIQREIRDTMLCWHPYPGGFTTIRTSIHLNLMTLLQGSRVTSTTLVYHRGANHPQFKWSSTSQWNWCRFLIDTSYSAQCPYELCSYWMILHLAVYVQCQRSVQCPQLICRLL